MFEYDYDMLASGTDECPFVTAEPHAGITAYCTMEPCLMCFGALMLHGIGAVVYAYEDAMGGGTRCRRSRLNPLYRNNRIAVRGGVRREESLALFKAFFSDRANRYWHASHLADYTLRQ